MSVVFSEIESVLLTWPDQLERSNSQKHTLLDAARLIRLQRWQLAEACLLASCRQSELRAQTFWLLGYLHLLRRSWKALSTLLGQVPGPTWGECPYGYLAVMLDLGADQQVSHWSWRQDSPVNHGFIGLVMIVLALHHNQLLLAKQLVDEFQDQDCLELQRLRADCLVRLGERDAALQLFRQLSRRCPQSQGLLLQFSQACSQLEWGADYIPMLRRATSQMGESAMLLPMITQAKLLKKEPGLGLRSALMHQAWLSITQVGLKDHVANKLSAYEMCGMSQWFDHIKMPSLDFCLQRDRVFASNLIFQFASVESPKSTDLAHELLDWFKKNLVSDELFSMPRKKQQGRLRVGWVTPDITFHPVARFLLNMLSQVRLSDQVDHVVVSISNNFVESSESLLPRFAACEGVSVHDLNRASANERIQKIRALSCDVVIDLAGWTGGEFQQGFLERLAPVQINYLGYFASTHNPSVDVWLGDAGVFPDSMIEPHSEDILSLPRPFLAWQPHASFPEATLPVLSAAQTGGICFGSFNANRKLSDRTLKVWGELLSQVPDARLVLKANSGSDRSTQELLRRRMSRHGLDPNRVIWLPLAETHEQHLQQYAQVDVALDCFPNGGCTTTCEALWMGVPVITLTGDRYVSRMSTSVLIGAGLEDFCATSESGYLEIAKMQATRLSWLRENRAFWREKVINSPLGDARDLMIHMTQAFFQLCR